MQYISIQIQNSHYLRVSCQSVSSHKLCSKLLTHLGFRNVRHIRPWFYKFSRFCSNDEGSPENKFNTNFAKEVAIIRLHVTLQSSHQATYVCCRNCKFLNASKLESEPLRHAIVHILTAKFWVVSPTHRPPYSPATTNTHFCQRLSRPQGQSAVGRIMAITKIPITIGNRNCYVPAWSAVPVRVHVPQIYIT
jgi:hypothetical protein